MTRRPTWTAVVAERGYRAFAVDGTAWRLQVSRANSRRWLWRVWHVLTGPYASGFQPTRAKALLAAKRFAEVAT
ncbi:MAG: hypothetical protein WBL29_05610 [Burkholderiales bacterium]